MQRLVVNTLWASFLAAVAALAAAFAVFDPALLEPLLSPRDRMAGYVLAFLYLWLVCALAAGLAQMLNSAWWQGGRKSDQDATQGRQEEQDSEFRKR